jgi:hypothetical protein
MAAAIAAPLLLLVVAALWLYRSQRMMHPSAQRAARQGSRHNRPRKLHSTSTTDDVEMKPGDCRPAVECVCAWADRADRDIFKMLSTLEFTFSEELALGEDAVRSPRNSVFGYALPLCRSASVTDGRRLAAAFEAASERLKELASTAHGPPSRASFASAILDVLDAAFLTELVDDSSTSGEGSDGGERSREGADADIEDHGSTSGEGSDGGECASEGADVGMEDQSGDKSSHDGGSSSQSDDDAQDNEPYRARVANVAKCVGPAATISSTVALSTSVALCDFD